LSKFSLHEKRHISLNSVINVENSNSLGFKGHLGEVSVSTHFVGTGEDIVIFGDPVNFPIKHVLDVHITGQGLLSDNECVLNLCRVGDVGITPESGSNFVEVDSGCLGIRGKIMEIRKSNLDLVLPHWSGIELSGIGNSGINNLAREVRSISRGGTCSIKIEEVLQRLILFSLNSFLHLFVILVVKVKIISSWNSDSITVLICFIDYLWHTISVTSWNSSILHKLNASSLNSGTRLGSVVGYRKDFCVIDSHYSDS